MQRIGDQICFNIPDDMKEKVDLIIKRHKMTRAEAVRALLSLGVEVYEDFEKVGIPQFAEMMKRTKQAIYDMRQRRIA